MVVQKPILASLFVLLVSWQVVGQVDFIGQALGSGDIGNSNPVSGGGNIALALTLGGVAGGHSATARVIPTATVETSSVTSLTSTLPNSGTTPLLFEGTATTRPFSTYRMSLPWKTTVGTAATGGVIASQPTGSAVNGASGVSTLAPTLGSSSNGSWTFSKSGMPIAPTLPSSQALSEVSTRFEISSPTKTISDGTRVTSTKLQNTQMVSEEKISAGSLYTSPTTAKVSSGFLMSTGKPMSFTGSATKVADQPSTWLIAALFFLYI